ncbi:MAG: hypothetical protein ACM3S4_04075 [Burkholderiales bacterium]
MENEFYSVTVICPAHGRRARGKGVRHKAKAFDARITFSDSYETTITCPNCGAGVSLFVKTKGKLTKARKEKLVREKQADLRRSLKVLLVSSLLLAAGITTSVFAPGETVGVVSVCAIVISLPVWIWALAAVAGAIKCLKHRELIFEKYELKHPYLVAIGEYCEHYFKGQKKTIVWQRQPIYHRLKDARSYKDLKPNRPEQTRAFAAIKRA